MGILSFFSKKKHPKYSEAKDLMYPLGSEEKAIERALDQLINFAAKAATLLANLGGQTENFTNKVEGILAHLRSWTAIRKERVVQATLSNINRMAVHNFEQSLKVFSVLLEKMHSQQAFIQDSNWKALISNIDSFAEELGKYKNRLLEQAKTRKAA